MQRLREGHFSGCRSVVVQRAVESQPQFGGALRKD